MHWRIARITLAAAVAAWMLAAAARADSPGQDDLDKATEAKLKARTIKDLGDVINLCESARKKGLDAENDSFAKLMLASTLAQRGLFVTRTILEPSHPDPNWPKFRDFALSDLEKAVALDAKQPEAWLNIARLHLLPGGKKEAAEHALDQAIETAADENAPIKAEALVLRAGTLDDDKKRLAKLDEAVKLAPDNPGVVFARAVLLADMGESDKSLADLQKVIELKPDHAQAYLAKAMVQVRQKKYDDALSTLAKAQELRPDSAFPFLQQARIHVLQSKLPEALKVLDRAALIEPGDVNVLLLRAVVHHELKDKEKALADVDRALRLKPTYGPALRMKASLLAGEGKLDLAIEELEKFSKENPKDTSSVMQLAMFYAAQENYAKAVEVFSTVLASEPNNFFALRGRADSLLGLGNHADAIRDYETAIKVEPHDSGLLNNFAWVLATSPDDKLRNGKRAIELATEACKLTDYKQSHILSTLGAAYAETGDFKTAMEWSEKAIAAGEPEQKDDLRKELESYRAGKPVRERKTPPADDPGKKAGKEPGNKAAPEAGKSPAKESPKEPGKQPAKKKKAPKKPTAEKPAADKPASPEKTSPKPAAEKPASPAK